jgi:hypothetical protein
MVELQKERRRVGLKGWRVLLHKQVPVRCRVSREKLSVNEAITNCETSGSHGGEYEDDSFLE